MKLLFVAPFERNRAFGGSQRATAIAERLERRGVSVDWITVEPSRRTRFAKMKALFSLEPAFVSYRPHGGGTTRRCDVAVAVHSYMWPHLASLDARARVIDFHNLEWQHIVDAATFASRVRRPYLMWQSALMRMFERKALDSAELSLFTTAHELDWARSSSGCRALVVPNVLPSSAVQMAERVRILRETSKPSSTLVYVGTLSFPPNIFSLIRFLEDVWPRIRAAHDAIRLHVVGDLPREYRIRVSGIDGVEASGFVDDLTDILSEASAAILPLDARAGSSLRVLLYGLAAVPMVGSPSAFRGFADNVGIIARSPDEWVGCIKECLGRTSNVERRIDLARETVLSVQQDELPWDVLHAALKELAKRRNGVPPTESSDQVSFGNRLSSTSQVSGWPGMTSLWDAGCKR